MTLVQKYYGVDFLAESWLLGTTLLRKNGWAKIDFIYFSHLCMAIVHFIRKIYQKVKIYFYTTMISFCDLKVTDWVKSIWEKLNFISNPLISTWNVKNAGPVRSTSINVIRIRNICVSWVPIPCQKTTTVSIKEFRVNL